MIILLNVRELSEAVKREAVLMKILPKILHKLGIDVKPKDIKIGTTIGLFQPDALIITEKEVCIVGYKRNLRAVLRFIKLLKNYLSEIKHIFRGHQVILIIIIYEEQIDPLALSILQEKIEKIKDRIRVFLYDFIMDKIYDLSRY